MTLSFIFMASVHTQLIFDMPCTGTGFVRENRKQKQKWKINNVYADAQQMEDLGYPSLLFIIVHHRMKKWGFAVTGQYNERCHRQAILLVTTQSTIRQLHLKSKPINLTLTLHSFKFLCEGLRYWRIRILYNKQHTFIPLENAGKKQIGFMNTLRQVSQVRGFAVQWCQNWAPLWSHLALHHSVCSRLLQFIQ